jgi:hypothetical protein
MPQELLSCNPEKASFQPEAVRELISRAFSLLRCYTTSIRFCALCALSFLEELRSPWSTPTLLLSL